MYHRSLGGARLLTHVAIGGIIAVTWLDKGSDAFEIQAVRQVTYLTFTTIIKSSLNGSPILLNTVKEAQYNLSDFCH